MKITYVKENKLTSIDLAEALRPVIHAECVRDPAFAQALANSEAFGRLLARLVLKDRILSLEDAMDIAGVRDTVSDYAIEN